MLLGWQRFQGLANLISQAQWQAMFPQRAGTAAGHPQGFTSDFYAYQKLQPAMQQMADYRATIETKAGVWGERITITRLGSGQQYVYAQPDNNWLQSTVPITTQVIKFADFANTPSVTQNKRELAAFLAHISKKTTGGWQFPIGGGSFGDYALWGLYFVNEVGYTPANSAGAYAQVHPLYPPNPAKGYYGCGNFTTNCYDSSGQAIENYLQCDVLPTTQTAVVTWAQSGLKAYPSPFSNQLLIELPDVQPMVSLVVRNSLGQVVYRGLVQKKLELQTTDWLRAFTSFNLCQALAELSKS